MTRYAIDLDRRALIAVWGTGAGDRAATIAQLSRDTDADAALRLAASLTALSRTLWEGYMYPADVDASRDSSPDDENRGRLGVVLDALHTPNLPQDGLLLRSYIPQEEIAHEAGRILRELDDASLTDAVAADVTEEVEAIDRADLGDVGGRARQAVLLDRADASPVQVAAADALLQHDPLGDERLFTEFDPTAAAVAAAHWLVAAADVASEATGVEPPEVIIEADNIEALPVETPTVVLRRIAAGETPREVVISLVREAIAVNGGELPNPDAVLSQIAEAEARIAQLGDRGDDDLQEALLSIRTTPLDPRRPARDLLEDLLMGIHGCNTLWIDAGYTEEPDQGAGTTSEYDVDEHAHDRQTAAFLDMVRSRAELDARRL